MNKNIIIEICNNFGINCIEIGDVIDTSRGDNDIRYNYIINKQYVLKLNTAEVVTRDFIQGMDKTNKKYRNIGVWCPQLLTNIQGSLLYDILYQDKMFHCYIEEYAPYEIAENKIDEYLLREEMVEHIGMLASKYTNIDLVDTYSMWSIIDLAPFDNGIDEKQDNLNTLV